MTRWWYAVTVASQPRYPSTNGRPQPGGSGDPAGAPSILRTQAADPPVLHHMDDGLTQRRPPGRGRKATRWWPRRSSQATAPWTTTT
jgi:hypothetical protein